MKKKTPSSSYLFSIVVEIMRLKSDGPESK